MMSQKYFFTPSTFLILLPISVAIFLLAVTGNIFILWESYKRYRSKRSIPDLLFYACCVCNIVSCFTGLSLHIAKIIIDYLQNITSSSYLCIFRYFSICSTTNLSLILLTALILSRKDKVLQLSFQRKSFIRNENVKYILVGFISISCIPQFIMAAIHFVGVMKKEWCPCQKPIKNSMQMIMNITGVVVMLLIAVPCITMIVRSISQMKSGVRTVKARSARERRQTLNSSINKINVSFMYAAVFFIFWVPFGIIASYADNIESEFYNAWYNIGYTVSFGYILFLPLSFILTNKIIQKDLRKCFVSFFGKKKKVTITKRKSVDLSSCSHDQDNTVSTLNSEVEN